MKPKALIVEDDDRIIDTIEDTLFSIGHEHDRVTNQYDAQELLKKGEYSYVLLDLQIPAKPNRGGAEKEFGCNLLKNIQRIKGPRGMPVIVMTAHLSDCLDLTTELQANGASEFIAKPFSNKGRTLASVIRKVLTDHTPKTSAPNAERRPAGSRTFAGGRLVVHPSHAELMGVTIISDRGTGQCMAILKQLCEKDSRGQFVRMSGEELVAAIRARGGVGTITGCVQTLRRNIVTRLRKAGIVAGRDDVIYHDKQGYCLRDWIIVCDGDTTECPSDVPADVPANVPPDVPVVPANVPAGPKLNQRQAWVLEQLERGVAVQRVMVEDQFGVGEKTAKRDLSELVREGLVVFVHGGRGGYYCRPDS